jgi:hypothetical protein
MAEVGGGVWGGWAESALQAKHREQANKLTKSSSIATNGQEHEYISRNEKRTKVLL